jgi:Skp family chaperone for outer membrane proteins
MSDHAAEAEYERQQQAFNAQLQQSDAAERTAEALERIADALEILARCVEVDPVGSDMPYFATWDKGNRP